MQVVFSFFFSFFFFFSEILWGKEFELFFQLVFMFFFLIFFIFQCVCAIWILLYSILFIYVFPCNIFSDMLRAVIFLFRSLYLFFLLFGPFSLFSIFFLYLFIFFGESKYEVNNPDWRVESLTCCLGQGGEEWSAAN